MEPRKLTKALVERGLVEKFVVDQLLVKLAPKETLSDRLVSEGLISEADLLHLIAEEAKTRFVSTRKLDDLRLSAELMEFIPLEAAEANVALPLAYEASSKTLSVVLGDLSRQSKLDDLPRFSRVERVVACIGMPGAIRAAIRRNYLGEQKSKPKPVVPTSKCSQCGMPVLEDQLECGTCGLLLNPNAPLDGTEARIVRALLSEPTGMHRLPSRYQVHEGLTRRGLPVEVKDHLVPRLAAGLEIVRSLSDFEAFVVSFIDGQLSVEGLAGATNLMGVEVSSVLASLAERKVLAFEDPTKPKEPPPPPEPPAPRPPTSAPKAAPPAPAPARPPAPVASRPSTPPAAVHALAPAAGPGARAHAEKKAAAVAAPTKPAEPTAAPAPVAAPERPKSPPSKPRHLTAEAQMENSLQSALALERRGEVDGAITVLKIAIARAPKPAALYNRLALVLLHQRRDTRQAEELIQKAMELEPENRVYKENLARVLSFAAAAR